MSGAPYDAPERDCASDGSYGTRVLAARTAHAGLARAGARSRARVVLVAALEIRERVEQHELFGRGCGDTQLWAVVDNAFGDAAAVRSA